MRVTAVAVVLVDEAGHGICVDAKGSGYWMGQGRACYGWLTRLWCCTSDALVGPFHMTFQCGRAGHEVFLERSGVKMWGAL